jgi:anti-sigma B factor antagonist
MKRHRTGAKIRLVAPDERGVTGAASDPTHAVDETSTRPQGGSHKAALTLAESGVRTHTLIPTGKLDRRSAPTLEAEIERLFGSGITSLVLDLRELTYVDSTGVSVLAFRCKLCKRHGYDLRLIPGSRLMQRAFEAAGVTDLLPPLEDRSAPAPLPAATSERPSGDLASGEGSLGR